MSFLVKTPPLPQSATQDGPQFSTYREAEAVPIGYGRDRFVSHWLCQPYDRKTRPTEKNRPDMEIASIVAGYRSGPIDFVGKIWRDGKEITNLDYRFAEHGEPESHTFSIPELGPAAKAIVHRGAVDAPAAICANLNAKTGQNHPPMRRQAWIEWVDVDLGQGTTALPDLQVEMGKATPAIGDFGASLFGQYGVNVFAAIHALLTDETGFGVDPVYFDAAHWAAQCEALQTIGIAERTSYDTFCNPVFKSAQEAGSMLSTMLAHVDGFLLVHEGKFRVGWFPSQPSDVGALPEISEHDLDGVPSGGNFPDWSRGPAAATVIYRDFDRNYGDTPALCPAPANLELGIVSTPIRSERPMIHMGDQALKIAAEIAASRATAESTISLPVQKSRAVKGDGSPLMPGDLFVWDYAPHSLDLVVRVIGRRMRSGQASDLLEIIPERGQYPLPYVPAFEPRVTPVSAPPGEINVADVRLWLLPSSLSTVRRVAALVNRSHRGIYRAFVHMSTAGAAPWDVILDSRLFVAKCAVTAGGIGNATATARVVSASVDFARMAAQSAVGQADDTLCALIDDELCSVGAITAVAANTYDLAILRGRRGTTAAAHADGAVAWLFFRDELLGNAVEHAEFYRVRDGSNIYNAGIATKYFKLQLCTIEEDGLAKPNDPGIALQLPDLSADDSRGFTIMLSNEAHVVACDSAGNPLAGALALAKTDVIVSRGTTPLTPVNAGPNSDQFSAALAVLTNATATKEDADTFRADSITANSASIAVDVLVAGAFTVRKVFSLSKANAGAAGAPGAPGAPGAAGAVGPGLVAMGDYLSSRVYYHTSVRRDVVKHGGNFWLTNNTGKSGTALWGTPGVADWEGPYSEYRFVATALLLAEDANITRTLVIGDGVTAGAGVVRSAGAASFGSGGGFWIGYEGTTPKFRIGDPAGKQLAWDGANLTAKFGSGSQQTLITDTYFLYGNPSGSRFQVQLVGSYVECAVTGPGGQFLYGQSAAGGYFSCMGNVGSLLRFEPTDLKLYFSNDGNAAWYRSGIGRLKTDGALETGGAAKFGGLLWAAGGFEQTAFNVHPGSNNQLTPGEDLGSDGKKYAAMRVNNRTVYIPFFESLP